MQKIPFRSVWVSRISLLAEIRPKKSRLMSLSASADSVPPGGSNLNTDIAYDGGVTSANWDEERILDAKSSLSFTDYASFRVVRTRLYHWLGDEEGKYLPDVCILEPLLHRTHEEQTRAWVTWNDDPGLNASCDSLLLYLLWNMNVWVCEKNFDNKIHLHVSFVKIRGLYPTRP